jgi:DNA recombination protein RmuC
MLFLIQELSMNTILLALALLNTVTLVGVLLFLRHSSASRFAARLDSLDQTLSQRFAAATADMASRLEQTKGDLRQQMTDRLALGFGEIRTTVDDQLARGRGEQAARLTEFSSYLESKIDALRTGTESKLQGFAESQADSLRAASSTLEQKFDQLSSRQTEGLGQSRQELAGALASTTAELQREFGALSERTVQSLETIRANVDEKLGAISGQVQQKLDENIREGFAHFTKVQEHLRAAEEQLRQVGALGSSINDLNNLLKLPHLRGQFGEASLERLLADFLPAHMYSLQSSPGEGAEHADALIHFPERNLPVDAKFPREQVLPLFESSDAGKLAEARKQLARVLRTEAKRIAQYIQPENGTMDVALMYLPSETLYFDAVTSAEAMDAVSKLKVYPVSPNTLLMTLHVIALAHQWYEVAARFEETRKELAKAQNSLGNFQKKFDEIGKGLEKAQTAYSTAVRHLNQYRARVSAISGEQVPEETAAEQLALAAGTEEA